MATTLLRDWWPSYGGRVLLSRFYIHCPPTEGQGATKWREALRSWTFKVAQTLVCMDSDAD